MADGVPITAGSGTTIATDDAGASGQVQIVKLAIGTDGSATVIPADATNGLKVDVARIVAVALDSATLTALETTELGATTLAALETIELGATSLAALETITIGTALPAGTNAIGKLSANSGVDIGDVDVTSLPALVAGSALVGDVGLQPRTSGGLSIFRSLDLDETEEEIKGSAGQVYGYFLANLHASSVRYVKFYNDTAANVSVGTTVPVLTYPLAAGEKANVSIPQGLAFSAGICAAATTGLADNDTGAPGANEVLVDVYYK